MDRNGAHGRLVKYSDILKPNIFYFHRALINTTVSYPTLTSNPVSDIDGHSRAVVVFVQAYDGQVSSS